MKPPAHHGMRVFAILGDSISVSPGALRGTATLAYQLQSLRPDLNVLNYSRNGWTAAAKIATNQANAAAIPALAPRLVLVELGTNDWSAGTPLDTFAAAYRQVLATVTARHASLYCLTPTWRAGPDTTGARNTAGLSLDDYRAAIRRTCTAAGGTPLDGLAAVPHSGAYFVDGLHPNAPGYRYFAAFLARRIH